MLCQIHNATHDANEKEFKNALQNTTEIKFEKHT